MTISKFRSLLYFVARFLGDVTAVNKGAIGKRVLRRATGKVTGRFLQKLIKKTWLFKCEPLTKTPSEIRVSDFVTST